MKTNKIFSGLVAVVLSLAAAFACFGTTACAGNGDNSQTPGGETPATYTVTFNANGHGTAPAEQRITSGGKARNPGQLTDSEYDFGGWYKDKECTDGQEYDFNTETVTADITLYAKWTKKQTTPGPEPEPPTGDTSTKLTGKIYVVGDSTVCDYSSNLDNAYLPRHGYGTQLYNYINCDPDQIVNLALSGRSSLDFLTDKSGNYNTLTSSIASGDYLIIGFGHNDEKKEDATRFTDPNKAYTDASTEGGPSFQHNLFENYVKMAKDKGATPILCTPIVRYTDKGTYSGSVVHNTSDGDYAQAIRTLGEATNTTVIDLTSITKSIYESDNDAAKYFHSHSTYELDGENKQPSGIDTTHLNKYGAKRVAYELAKAVLATDNSLKNHVITNSAAPTYEADFADAIRPDYVKPDYTPFDPENTTATKIYEGDNAAWYATAMGELGGNSTTPFKATYADGVFNVQSDPTQAKGKITSAVDGFAAAFIQIPAGKNFTASVKAKVKTLGGSVTNQTAFGLMIRDDIIINQRVTTLNTNYVTAGILGATKGTDTCSGKAIFKRESAALASESNNVTFAEGAEFTFKLERVGQNITATVISGTQTYTATYKDLKLNMVDIDNMYLCLMATRSIEIEYSDMQFSITGDAGQA